MKTLGDLGEDAVVATLIKTLNQGAAVLVGPGDDCAVIDSGNAEFYQLLKTDCIVENIHYESDMEPERIGWKAVARVMSDFAAMGGEAEHLLVTIAMSKNTRVNFVERLYTGMQRCASSFGADICGGETSSISENSSAIISVAGTGRVMKDRCVTRAGGKEGDAIIVSGELGGSIKGKHLDFTPRIKEATWLTQNYDIHAMMDLSDGVGRDLPRLAAASGCGYQIFPNDVPLAAGCNYAQALGDGEDYELMFAVDAADAATIIKEWQKIFPEVLLTKIGGFCEVGQGDEPEGSGWQHFSS